MRYTNREMKIHHIGYAVKDIIEAGEKLKDLGFKCGPVINDYQRNINIIFANNDNQRIELVATMDSTKDSALGGTLKKRGVGAYHMCYEVENLNAAVEELTKKKFRVIVAPQVACALDDRKVVFLWNNDIGMIELVEQHPE